MKKLFCINMMVFFFTHLVSGQTERGTWQMGGSAAYISSSGKSTLAINPSIGYFLIKHLAGGAQLNLVTITGSTSWTLGPFAKYYFYGDERGRYYVNVGLNVGDASGSKFDTGYSFGAGYAKFFLNSSISIDLGAQYFRAGSIKGIFNLGAGFQIHFNRLRD